MDTDPSYVEVEKQEGADHETYERVKKQINAIAKEVSEGSDTLAGKWLRQLVEEQTSVAGGEEFAVKSLCNIAQICADMFRNDFEIICLEMALELKPFDEWALIQHGDHLKRGGNYEEALKVLDQARRYGESVVAISSIADVYSEQGDYEKAISVYKTIPAWSETPAVLTGIADNLRKMGRMDESISTYEQLNQRARQGLPGYEFSESRAQAGLAEVAKRQGRFEDALRIYEGILQHESPDIQDKPFYRLGLCNVLTLMGYFKRAYSVVDNVIVDYPFAREARFMRAAILGLIGRETRGLEDVPEGKGTGSGREWLGSYYRGLLLFRLKRYEDAKRILVRELPNTVAAGETRAKLRLGATLCHLREGSILEADAILSDIPDLYNCHLQYLSLVLRLHSAAQKEDRDIIARLRKQIDDLDIVDSTLGEAVMAIDRGDLSLAISYATDALIKLAA